MKKLSALMSALLLATLIFTACGDNGSTSQGGSGSDVPTTSSGAQEITFALQNEPDSLDPGYTNNSFASPFLVNVFEGLVTYDTKTGELVGGNAESWDISDDGTVYTFKLRDGLKWSDGTDLTAEDYAYTFLRLLDPATGAQYVELVTEYIVNAQEYYDGEATEEDLGVKVIDENTLELTLIDAAPFYLDILTMWTFSPVQKATVEANGDSWHTSPDTYVVNGPFMVSEINMGESIVLVKNPNYYAASSVQLEKITFRYILDVSTALSAFESGEIDGSRKVPAADMARLRADDAGLVLAPSYGTTFFDINNEAGPFNDPLVRKAINLAVDRNAIINDVLNNFGTPAYSLVAPGYAVDGEDFAEGRGSFGLSATSDVEAAQAALAEAGYPNGEGFPTITVSYYTDDNAKKMAEAVAEMLSTNLNINVEITNAEWAVFYEDIKAGNYEIAAMGWGADYLHPMSFLPLQVTGNTNNHTGYSNPEYDALVEQAMVETDPAKAMDLMRQADEIAGNEYPLLCLFYRTNSMLMSDNVEGYYLSPSDHIYFKDAFVVG